MVTLFIKPLNSLTYGDYDDRKNHSTDSGLDLFVQENIICQPNKVTFIGHQIACEMFDLSTSSNIPFLLTPRSSISKTPLIMANSIGIIDKDYRGEIIGAVYNTSSEPFEVKGGARLFQIILPSLEPFDFKLIEELSDTRRGKDGFGSTGI